MLDYNIDCFLDNISSRFNIPRKELDELKYYKKNKLEVEYIEKKNTIYIDRDNNKYVLLENGLAILIK
jgi:hypothetical protein